MPVAQRRQASTRQAVLVALGGVGGLVAIMFLITQLGQLSGGGAEVPMQSGQPVFRVGKVADLAPLIEQTEPLLLPDPSGGDRDVIINHVGDSATDGWVAFAARPLTAPRHCSLEWQADSETFIDSCSGTSYPPDGRGLVKYATSVDEDGNLQINLNITSTPND